jgi:hypothetical protein
MSGSHRAYVVVPASDTETIIAKQIRTTEVDREGWNLLSEDRKWVIDLLRRVVEQNTFHLWLAVQLRTYQRIR